MTADIELLPLPDDLVGDLYDYEDRELWGRPTRAAIKSAIEVYGLDMARHNVKARDAEIEALRAEVDAAIQTAWQQSQFREQAQARAERLAEALRDALECGNDGDWQSARQYITAALRDHDQEAGNG